MNSRERLLIAVERKEPDKIPIDFGATLVTGPTRVAYENLREYLGLEPDPALRISHRPMQSVYPREDFLQHYQVDCRPVHMRGPLNFEPREMEDDSYYDEFGIRWKKASYYYDVIERPLASYTLENLDEVSWPDPNDPGRVAGLPEDVRNLHRAAEYAIVADIANLGPFEGACVLRGYEQFCVDLCWDTDFAEALLDKVTENSLNFLSTFLAVVGDYVQVVAQGDDVGMQTSLYISPEMYRKFIKPRQKRLFDFIHENTEAKVFYHSCGSVYDIIPDLIEIGVDALNPVQRGAAKMDIVRLKKEFGRDICFWGGGIDIQHFLPFASLAEIEADVRRTLDVLAPGGGFVFAPTHNVQADVTPDRIDRAYRTVLSHRDY